MDNNNDKFNPAPGHEVVISGISGLFPKSDNVQQFMENLYNKIDMVMPINNSSSHPELPKHVGKISSLEKFDAQFFKVTYNQAMSLEPMCRKLMEHSYSAIYDSGLNPFSISGKKTGVFVGTSYGDFAQNNFYHLNKNSNKFYISGSSKCMQANRISYYLNAKGPSYVIDQSCASSLACLELAYKSIINGECENALVGGCNICRDSIVAFNLRQTGFLTLDGKTKCFDKGADGYVRAETIGVLFLQKAKDARRIYAEVCHVKMNYELHPHSEFSPKRETESILKFLEKFYSEINVSPDEVEYVEAHASAIPNADRNELEAISKFFSKKKPIKIGSVKSNMGHGESASGISSLTKICLAYHTGKIAANLHFEDFDESVSSICKDKLQVLQEHADFERKYVALNCFSYTGANVHVLLKGHYKKKNTEKYRGDLPQLLNVSCRNESNVQELFNKLLKNPFDAEQIALCRCIYEVDTPGHTFRGHIILDTNEQKETEVLSQSIEYFDGSRRPVCFVYSGMGSQWPGMGAELLRIPIFASAVERCHAVLEPLGVNIYEVLCDTDNDVFKNIINSFVGINVIQIGLTDILKSIGVTADYIIGHSLGEIACAYADGCLSLEETILTAYGRGMVSIENKFIHGSMAAVGLGYKEIQSICPSEIDIACHNSSTSSTISGPAEVMKTFVNQLTAQQYFAKEVACNNIPFHSRYIAHAGADLNTRLKEVIKQAKLRSKKWISSSVLKSNWASDAAKYSSAEYHTNNLLSPVYFEEASKFIPENAIYIEIAPHGLLNAILKRSKPTGVHIPLTKRLHSNPIKFMLEAVGKLYLVGLNPKIAALYPRIEYPVSTETPMLSHLVEWEHSENWPIEDNKQKKEVFSVAREYNISTIDDEYRSLSEYNRNGVHVFPEMLFLILAWQTFTMANRKKIDETSIIFENIKFYSEILVRTNDPPKIYVSITKGSNRFEVTHNDSRIADGIINFMEECTDYEITEKQPHRFTECYPLTMNDIYILLNLKGYSHSKIFRCFQSCSMNCDKANILWRQDWTAFLDALIQFNILGRKHIGVSVPKFIRKISIDTTKHYRTVKVDSDGNKIYNADILHIEEVTKCGGVTIEKAIFEDIPLIQQEPDIIYNKQFRPYFTNDPVDLKAALMIQLQIAIENNSDDCIVITEIISLKDKFNSTITEALELLSFQNFELKLLEIKNSEYEDSDVYRIKNSHLLFGNNLLKDKKIYSFLKDGTFVISLQTDTQNFSQLSHCIISSISMKDNSKLILFKKSDDCASIEKITNVSIYDQDFSIKRFNDKGYTNKDQILLESGCEKYYEGTRNRIESNGLTHIFIEDENSTVTNIDNQLFKKQLKKKLKYNVLRKGQWGGYFCSPIRTEACSDIIRLTIKETGNLDTLSWIQQPAPKAHTTNFIKVEYAGLSLQDYYKAIKLESNSMEKLFGMDFSGMDPNGNRVMGLLSEGSLSNYVIADSTLLWPVPKHWRLDEGATVILPYVHAYYCLFFNNFGINYGRVFINGGAGAFGIAVIAICLSLKWEVYTTVGNIEKKRFLHKLFPRLEEDNVACSDTDAFYQVVVKKTNNELCNIVINCAGGTDRRAFMKYAGFRGVFLDISRYEILSDYNFGMFYLENDRVYKSVNMSNIFGPERMKERQILQRLVAHGIATGTVIPIPKVIYSPHEVVKGLRLLSRRQHKGRVLIKMSKITSEQHMQITPRTICSSDATQIIVYENLNLCISIIERLLNRGCRKVLICGNGHHKSEILCFKMRSWERSGVIVRVFDMAIKTAEDCSNAINEAEKLGPVEGIFITMSNEQNISKMNAEKCIDETVSKICNFDILSRKLCKSLRFFVIMHDDLYDFGCKDIFLIFEKICQDRRDQGFPALSYRTKIGMKHSSTDNSDTSLSISAALNGLEVGIETGYTKILALYKKEATRNSKFQFLSKISQILGVKNVDQIHNTVVLGDLIQNINVLEELRTLIKNTFQLNYTVQDLERMPIESLYEMQDSKTEKTKFDEGIAVFISNIEEEINATVADYIRIMPTLYPRNMEDIMHFDHDGKYLILLPGLDGNHQIFLPLFERLKIRAVIVDYETISDNDSFKKMAANVLKNIKKRLNIKSKFYVMGYSFGINIAIELVGLLEEQGYSGILYALDSSPDALKVQFDAYVGQLSEADLQNVVLKKVFSMVSRKTGIILDENLERSGNWEEKINDSLSKTKHSLRYSHQYIRKLLETLYKRIVLFKHYKPNVILNSEIILIKGTAHPNSNYLENDYALSKYSKHPVKIFNIESDHAMAPHDLKVSSIVNQHLDADYIKKYNDFNFCKSYFV